MQDLNTDIEELINKPSIQQFLKAARQFIDLLEEDDINHGEFYSSAHKAMAELYKAGLGLETIDLKYSEPNSKFPDLDMTKLQELNIDLISNLGKYCFYWKVFDPVYDKEKEPTQGWLVDDFSDIYADLKEEIYKIDNIRTNESIEDALWQLKFGFNHHWGNHCIDAMRALHYLWYEGKVAM